MVASTLGCMEVLGFTCNIDSFSLRASAHNSKNAPARNGILGSGHQYYMSSAQLRKYNRPKSGDSYQFISPALSRVLHELTGGSRVDEAQIDALLAAGRWHDVQKQVVLKPFTGGDFPLPDDLTGREFDIYTRILFAEAYGDDKDLPQDSPTPSVAGGDSAGGPVVDEPSIAPPCTAADPLPDSKPAAVEGGRTKGTDEPQSPDVLPVLSPEPSSGGRPSLGMKRRSMRHLRRLMDKLSVRNRTPPRPSGATPTPSFPFAFL